MEIELPNAGCNYLSSYNTVDNYNNNVRTRYYLIDGKLVQSNSSSYTRLPDNAYCLQPGDLVYKPEIPVYFSYMAFTLVAFAGILLFNIIIKNLWKGR